MAPTQLGRVLDREARDADVGERALLRLEVHSEWLELGGTLEIDAPHRLVCARCDGGGCASCANSGALRVDIEERTLQLTLSPGSDVAKRLRLEDPFGKASSIRQVLIDLVPSEGPTSSMARWTPLTPRLVVLSNPIPAHPIPPASAGTQMVLALAVVLALALALAAHLR